MSDEKTHAAIVCDSVKSILEICATSKVHPTIRHGTVVEALLGQAVMQLAFIVDELRAMNLKARSR